MFCGTLRFRHSLQSKAAVVQMRKKKGTETDGDDHQFNMLSGIPRNNGTRSAEAVVIDTVAEPVATRMKAATIHPYNSGDRCAAPPLRRGRRQRR